MSNRQTVKVGDKVAVRVLDVCEASGSVKIGIDNWLWPAQFEPVAVADSNGNRFKVGDRVRCVDDTSTKLVTKGKIYTVEGIQDKFVKVRNNNMFSHRFELVDAPLTIQAGKFYRTRDGRKVGPAEISDDYEYPWRASGALYMDNGRWLNDDIEDDNDIVAEWIDEPDAASDSSNDTVDDWYYGKASETTGFTVPLEAPEFGGGESKFKVGDRVVVANNESDRISYVGKTGEVVHVGYEVTVKLDESVSELFFRESELRLVAEATNRRPWMRQHEDNVTTSIAAMMRRLERLEARLEANQPIEPEHCIGDKVTLSATVTGMNNQRVNVVIDGVPQPGGSLAVPPAALIAA